MRRTWFLVVSVLVISLGFALPSASGAEISAKSNTRVEDPAGDVPYYEGDLIVASAR